MKNSSLIVLAVIASVVVTIGLGVAFYAHGDEPVVGSGSGTIGVLDQWKSDGTNITQRTASKSIKITGLTPGSLLCLTAGNILTTSGCSSAGGITALVLPQGSFTGSITFATSTSVTNGVTSALTIVGSGSTFTFTSSQSGILTVPGGGSGWAAVQSGTLLYGNGTGALATTSLGVAGQTLALLNGIPTWTATTTFASPLVYSAGSVSCPTCTVGGLTSYDAFTHTTIFGSSASATSTQLHLTGTPSLTASSTVYFGTAGQDLTFNATNGYLGLASTSPFGLLSISGNLQQYGAYSHFGTAVCNSTALGVVSSAVELCGNDNTINGVQMGIANNNAGASAYSLFFLNNDRADATATHYGAIGYTGSKYNDNTYGTGLNIVNQIQFINTDGPITSVVSTTTSGSYFNWLTKGTATGNEVMRLTGGGFLGLGTTTPWANLSITGVQAQTAPLFAVASSTTGNTIQPLRFLIDSNGFVSIGSTTPKQRLDIHNGALRFSFAAPITAPTTALAGLGAGNVPNGTYVYKIQCRNALGDGFLGATSSPVTVTDNTVNGQITLTVPLCPDSSVTQRRLWRSNNNGASLSWLAFNVGTQSATLNNNTVTTFTDNIAAPADNFGNIPADAFDSGYIFGEANKGYSISALGISKITGNVGINGGLTTDNSGTASLGVALGSNKCAVQIQDNFSNDCGTAYLGIVQSNGSKSVLSLGRVANSVSNDMDGNGSTWMSNMGVSNTASSNSLVGYGARIVTLNVVNTGTTTAFGSKNYIQGGNISKYVAFHSYGQYGAVNSTVINQYDFRADDFNGGSANGTSTNRYGVYLGFGKAANATLAYGIYQLSSAVSNYFGGNVGIGTTTPAFALDVKGTGLLEPQSDPSTAYNGSYWYSTVANAFSGFIAGIQQWFTTSNFVMTTQNVVANTTTETSILGTAVGTSVGTTTLPANFWVAGKAVTIHTGGTYGTKTIAPGNLTIKVKWGSTTLASETLNALLSAANSAGWDGDVIVTCLSLTAGNCTFSIAGHINYAVANPAATNLAAIYGDINNSGATISADITTSQRLDITATWQTADVANVATTTGATMSVMH